MNGAPEGEFKSLTVKTGKYFNEQATTGQDFLLYFRLIFVPLKVYRLDVK